MSETHDSTSEIYTIDNPPPRQTPEQRAEATWQRIRLGGYVSALAHLRPGFLERVPVPIKLYGHASDGWGRVYSLYRDAQGRKRVFSASDHDRNGIASLFDGAEGWLPRLWPAPNGGWDDEKAAETLMHFSACIGPVNAATIGFELPPVSIERMAAMLGIPPEALREDWPAPDGSQ